MKDLKGKKTRFRLRKKRKKRRFRPRKNNDTKISTTLSTKKNLKIPTSDIPDVLGAQHINKSPFPSFTDSLIDKVAESITH